LVNLFASRRAKVQFPDQDGQDDRFQDPNYLAQATGRIHQQQPDMLGQLMGGAAGLGGGGGNARQSSPGDMAGIAAMAVKR